MPVALWSVGGEKPQSLRQHTEYIERHLEEWVQSEPALVMGGLRWVARQPWLPDRTRPDLIGVTREGALVVAELKREAVGIATLSQALHYVLWLGSLKNEALIARLTKEGTEERAILSESVGSGTPVELIVMLIGTVRLPELDEAAAFLAARGLAIPIKIVTFTPFEDMAGQVLLARDVEDHDVAEDEVTPRERSRQAASVERVRELAQEAGVLGAFDAAIELATELGLRVKPWRFSITIVPPFTHGRTLVYLSPRPGLVYLEYNIENLVELYAADRSNTESQLGHNSTEVTPEQAEDFLQRFRGLMESLQDASRNGDGNQTVLAGHPLSSDRSANDASPDR